MNNTNSATQNPKYTYVLTYIENDSLIECHFSTAQLAIADMCERGRGCIRRKLWDDERE